MAEYPETIKEDMSHMRWICGSSLGGKTTITKKLATKLDLDVYHIDSHWSDYFQRSDKAKHPHLYRGRLYFEEGGTFAETELLPIEEQKTGLMRAYEECFGMIVEDPLHLAEEDRAWRKAHPNEVKQIKKQRFWIHRWVRDQVLEKAQSVGMMVIVNDGSRSIDELTETVREHFGF